MIDGEMLAKAFLRILFMGTGTLIADTRDIISNHVPCKLDRSREAQRRSSLAAW